MNQPPLGCRLVLVVALIWPAAAVADTGGMVADPLWRKAVAIVGANDTWTAGSSVMTGQEADGKGRIRNTWMLWTRTAPGPDGKAVQEIVRFVENGKDVTEQRRSAQRSQSGGGGGRGGGAFDWNPSEPRQTPFHPDRQGDVSIRRLAAVETLDGRICVTYGFEQRIGDREKAVGKVWLDAATGAPLQLTGSVQPLPVFVHSGEVLVRYTLGDDGSWMVSRFRLGGDITFLLIRRSFTMDMTMADHWRTGVGTPGRT